jgi:hypothetical protein
MKTNRAATGGIALLMTVLLGAAATRGQAPAPASARPPEAAAQSTAIDPAAGAASGDVGAVTRRYCVTCHNQRMKTGGLVLDTEGITNVGEHAEVWEKVVRKVRGGFMPPGGSPRPEPAALSAWVNAVERALDGAAAARPNPGRIPAFHRLNRVEYTNVIRDLLDLEVDGASLLPVDDAGHGFDNNADVLSISPTLMERYMLAASKISRLAMGTPMSRPAPVVYMNSPYLWQEDRISPELPFGSRGGIAVKHTFPVDGEYESQIRIPRKADYTRFLTELPGEEPLEVRVDYERVKVIQPSKNVKEEMYDERKAETGSSPLTFRLPIKAGPRLIGMSFVADMEHRLPIDTRPQRPSLAGFFFQQYATDPQLLGVQIIGPFNAGGAGDTPSRRRILVCRPSAPADEESCARKILTGLANRAFRGTAGDPEVQTLMAAYKIGRGKGDFETGIQWALETLLVQPGFLFRVVRDPAEARPGVPYRLNDLELASRLSFFLWSSIPDDELVAVAKRGQLSDPNVLQQQVRRMVADPRSTALAKNFAGQWLWLRKLNFVLPDPLLFPTVDDNLRQAMRQETEMFIESQVREDRSLRELLTANYTFLNERTAQHYGVANVYGSHFRRVTLTDERRFGLLGHGSIQMVTSYANRTSPVIRGLWLLENFLGAPPPPPPPNVPPLKENIEGEKPTTVRARLEQHRRNPACATCHRTMDPPGFALENFDAVGRWRAIDAESKEPIDASGTMPDGTKFDGIVEFRGALARRHVEFITTVVERLMTYALGRGAEYFDRPAIREIVRNSAANDYRWSSIILGVVNSQPFQMRMITPDVATLKAEQTASPAGGNSHE